MCITQATRSKLIIFGLKRFFMYSLAVYCRFFIKIIIAQLDKTQINGKMTQGCYMQCNSYTTLSQTSSITLVKLALNSSHLMGISSE